MEYQSVGQGGGAPDTLPVPPALDLPAPDRRFSAEAMRRKVKVLFVVSQPTGSPALAVHANLMRLLNRDRVEVHVLYNVLAEGEPYRSAGTSVLDILPEREDLHLRPGVFGPVGGAPPRRLLASAARSLGPALRDSAALVRYIRRHRIDIIHCEEGPRNAFYALLLARITPAKSVVHFHSKYGSWMSPLSRLGVRHADAIIAVSSWTGRVIHEAGVPRERIFPVLNGIDVTGWDPATIDGDGVRREFGLGPQAPLIVMVAQLVAWKRQTTLIEAFRRVAAAYPDARLLIVGREFKPDPAPGELTVEQQLRRQVTEAGLDEQVTFAGQRRDVRQILAAADVFAHPSVDDPCPMAHIEAMAMATPVAAVQAGGAPELVAHGQTGLLSPADDSGALADNLMALIGDPDRRQAMGERGRARVLEYLNLKRVTDDVEGVYRLAAGLASV